MAYALAQGNLPIVLVVALFALGLFLCAMACHGELALLKPLPRYLTHFYLTIAAGGALGGLAVGLLAPHVFSGYYEMPLGLVGCAGLMVVVLKTDPAAGWFRRWWQPAPIVSLAVTLGLAVYVATNLHLSNRGVRLRVRNFYGELTVEDSDPPTAINATRTLLHGTITHGDQFLNPALRDLPTTYYGPSTGVGLAIRDRALGHAVRVGVIGLGTGTLAAYARPGDYYRYYEINPLVLRVARSQFTFLEDCRGKLEVAMGDARLSLEREQPENFDVLAVDAFSSDAIPVHLLTREAMDVYFRHLRPDGILAVHISNHHLDLEPVVAGEAQSSGRRARMVDTEDDGDSGVFAATWVLVTAPPNDFDNAIRASSNPLSHLRRVRPWTDDYSNLFQILK
jgi:SAM-dependent methyltransferase